MYWSGLVVVPLIAMYVVRKQRGREVDGQMSKPIAYMLWLCGGFVGLHRFYAKSAWGLLYIPLFVALMLCNAQYRHAFNEVSGAINQISIAEFDLERAEKDAKIDAKEALPKLVKAQKAMETARQQLAEKKAAANKWILIVRIFAIVIALMLIVDAFLLPKLVNRCAEEEACTAETEAEKVSVPIPGQESQAHETLTGHVKLDNKIFQFIDKLNGYVAEFVCFWSIIAVFVYYYEVVGRYVFNSPTNWAHEGMFLMFGMQYVLAAGFTNREGAHVHVDVIYQYFPDRVKAITDLFTSIFFFIFVIAIIWTSWIFAMDSMRVWEVSFTEWAIQYWPVKLTMILGGVLLLADGIVKVIKDFHVLVAKRV
jgi:TRAP-type mannitol/chloroaromatic compound transport system permease small subunit